MKNSTASAIKCCVLGNTTLADQLTTSSTEKVVSSKNPTHTLEILTLEEFSERLKIGRSTLFEWMKNGVVVPGKHYVKIGRIVRFYWHDDVLFSLEIPQQKKTNLQTKTVKNNHRKQPSLNWDY